jgi:hypothetical protein
MFTDIVAGVGGDVSFQTSEKIRGPMMPVLFSLPGEKSTLVAYGSGRIGIAYLKFEEIARVPLLKP